MGCFGRLNVNLFVFVELYYALSWEEILLRKPSLKASFMMVVIFSPYGKIILILHYLGIWNIAMQASIAMFWLIFHFWVWLVKEQYPNLAFIQLFWSIDQLERSRKIFLVYGYQTHLIYWSTNDPTNTSQQQTTTKLGKSQPKNDRRLNKKSPEII